MKALGALLLLELLGRAWCCRPEPGDSNIATLAVASQSSTYGVGYANKSTDGVKTLLWSEGSCSSTDLEWGPWWRLDMKLKYKVKVVVLSLMIVNNRMRSLGMELRIGDSPDNKNPLCGKVTSTDYLVFTFLCHGMEGRYISLVLPGVYEYLFFCEVEVYGDLVI